jgi:alpha-1,3-mannosyltransferase
VGCRNGYFASEDEIGEACRDIRSADADLVLVGMGNPRQELWIARHGKATGATLLFGVGALFDFVTGEVRRAPPWIQRLRCEWVYRLTREPGRLWRRYCIGNVSFLARLMRDRYRVFVP